MYGDVPFRYESKESEALNVAKRHELNQRSEPWIDLSKYPGSFSQGDNVVTNLQLPDIMPEKHERKDGSQITVDEFNRVTAMRDAANRVFQFKYDNGTGELNQITGEHGTWHRERRDGRYSNEWKDTNDNIWKGEVDVNPHGYSYSDGTKRTIYTPRGEKIVEQLGPDRAVLHRNRQDRVGNIADEDISAGTVKYQAPDGRTALRNVKENSLLAYDAQGHLTMMKDSAGSSFKFANFDQAGNPQKIENASGVWLNQGGDRWVNPVSKASWTGKVELDKDGVYSYTEPGGRRISHSKDGRTKIEEKGMITVQDKNGSKAFSFSDGKAVEPGAARREEIKFKVEKGITTLGTLSTAGSTEIKHEKNDVYAMIKTNPDSTVRALQDGRVAYSFNHKGKPYDNALSAMRFNAKDMAMIEQYKSANPNQDFVVLECWDKQARGTRYQVYGGLNLASAQPGDRVQAGETIGRSGEQGYTYSAHRQRLSGQAINFDVVDKPGHGVKDAARQMAKDAVEGTTTGAAAGAASATAKGVSEVAPPRRYERTDLPKADPRLIASDWQQAKTPA